MEKHRIYIVLTRTNTLLSRMIHHFTKDDYTHAAISFDEKLESMYSFGRKKTFNPFIGGFKKEGIDEGLYRFCKSIPCRIIEIEVSQEQQEKAQQVVNEFRSNSDSYKYNYKGLLYCLQNKVAENDRRFLCSEFVYHVLKESGIVDFHVSRNLVRPQNFMALEGKNFYQGNLKEFGSENNSFHTRRIKIGALHYL